MKKFLLVVTCLVVGAPMLAAALPSKNSRPPPCQVRAPERNGTRQGSLLWGTVGEGLLVSVSLTEARLEGKSLPDLRLEGGRLVAAAAPLGGVGAVLQGKARDDSPVEVAVCRAEPEASDPSQVWYQLEVWKPKSETWENPCLPTEPVSAPRALALPGVWDMRGARHSSDQAFTFACEAGALAKCVEWGYKPWALKDGVSLVELHQTCTRMARADYCGDGRSHTREGRPIDVYDALKVQTRAMVSSRIWDPALGSFEAAWNADGAVCLSHTRDGQPVEEAIADCRDRFQRARVDLGEEVPCALVRKGVRVQEAPLRNRSYGKSE